VLRDIALGYYTPEEAGEKFGVNLSADGLVIDRAATDEKRAGHR
jgi:N-methylhydantoinase B